MLEQKYIKALKIYQNNVIKFLDIMLTCRIVTS